MPILSWLMMPINYSSWPPRHLIIFILQTWKSCRRLEMTDIGDIKDVFFSYSPTFFQILWKGWGSTILGMTEWLWINLIPKQGVPMVISSYHQRRCCLKIINLGSKPTTSISRGFSRWVQNIKMKSRYNKPFCLNFDSFLRDRFFVFLGLLRSFFRSKTKKSRNRQWSRDAPGLPPHPDSKKNVTYVANFGLAVKFTESNRSNQSFVFQNHPSDCCENYA